jgi:hypothetical protein
MNSTFDLFLNHEAQLINLSQRLMNALSNLLSESVLTDDELLDLAQVVADKGNTNLLTDSPLVQTFEKE